MQIDASSNVGKPRNAPGRWFWAVGDHKAEISLEKRFIPIIEINLQEKKVAEIGELVSGMNVQAREIRSREGHFTIWRCQVAKTKEIGVVR